MTCGEGRKFSSVSHLYKIWRWKGLLWYLFVDKCLRARQMAWLTVRTILMLVLHMRLFKQGLLAFKEQPEAGLNIIGNPDWRRPMFFIVTCT